MNVKIKLHTRDVQVPINDAHVEALELVDVVEGDAADGGDVLVRVIDVIVHLAGHKHCRQNQSKKETQSDKVSM